MYQCILINPRSIYYSGAERLNPSHYAGLMSIAGVLAAKGFSVRLADMVLEDDPLGALKKHLDSPGDETFLAGFSVMTSQLPHAMELSRFLRKNYPGIKIVWGGVHPSLFPETVCASGLADFVCLGEGEFATAELLSALKAGKKDFSSIKGLCFADNGRFVCAEPRPPHSLDELPYFNYALTDYPKYMVRRFHLAGGEAKTLRYGVILTGVGCPYRCTFCINSNKKLYHGKYRSKTPARIVAELEFLIKEHGIEYFEFLDDNFFINRKNVAEFLSLVREKNLKFSWFTNIRADYFRPDYVNESLLEELEAAGCHRLAIGAESGSQRMLDKLKKDIKVRDIKESARLLGTGGIKATYSFMMGLPGETKQDITATLDLMQELRALKREINFIGPQIFRPYPGGELYEECVEKYGYRPPRDLGEWETALNLFSGYENLEKMGWISEKKFVRTVSFYIEFMNLQVETLGVGGFKKAVLSLFRKLFMFRVSRRFWKLNLEAGLILFYKRLKSSLGRG